MTYQIEGLDSLTKLALAVMQYTEFTSFSLKNYPQIKVCVIGNDFLEATEKAFAEIEEAVPSLLAYVAENAPPRGVVIFVSQHAINCAYPSGQVIFINPVEMQKLHYMGLDGNFYPLLNLSAVIAHELQHIRSFELYHAYAQHIVQAKTAGILSKALKKATRSLHDTGLSADEVQDYLRSRTTKEGDKALNPEIEAIIDGFEADFFSIGDDALSAFLTGLWENPSIDIENIFHERAGEPLRAHNYTGELNPANPTHDDEQVIKLLLAAYNRSLFWRNTARKIRNVFNRTHR
ncbi:MAG: hypothetical protein EAZ74_02285 [Alphaproteobacteria bacterium]|nr:MAG: hypothetical protein EAY76_06500 [Alphaproteobacteria bacterium]TAF15166.1 MAG: hypothetical protein EAZ74_02285 [Alphaproteobacteria bacterium]TAF41517.1 MAG: hypothetical protein EAZ66_01220 [Alphaproteobacteria bacterium]TAF77041.1 MAG: hypothetical protein EAZ52_02660 [Alphaproteobacteria bacterium]